jgi:hypothetical protein
MHRAPLVYPHHPISIGGGPVPPYRGHLQRAQRQPPSLDFSAELFGLSISSAPIKLISKKKKASSNATNFRYLSNGELAINADAIELATRNNQQKYSGMAKRNLGIIGTHYYPNV